MKYLHNYIAVMALMQAGWAAANPNLDASIQELQQEWAVVKYQTAKDRQDAAFTLLEAKAESAVQAYPQAAEPLVWEAIILSTHAGVSGGLGALSKVKQARVLLEKAASIEPNALHGSIYTSLGSLYYQVPGWPIGFGDDKKAEQYLKQALTQNPDGIDQNYFYGDFLRDQGRYKEAVTYLTKAINAAPRPHRELADQGRREEAKHVLAMVEAKLAK
ncbi:MAG TPA: tetratricopeptide repeat protein [Gammaproteobacteria bacterium]|jgi:tetratricopeptide (TPR) repeat protein|nr:tetratricopeptide repeat protein [Gammaproteobacteria bacterium]